MEFDNNLVIFVADVAVTVRYLKKLHGSPKFFFSFRDKLKFLLSFTEVPLPLVEYC